MPVFQVIRANSPESLLKAFTKQSDTLEVYKIITINLVSASKNNSCTVNFIIETRLIQPNYSSKCALL